MGLEVCERYWPKAYRLVGFQLPTSPVLVAQDYLEPPTWLRILTSGGLMILIIVIQL